MSLDTRPQTFTPEDYARIFELERRQFYPAVDAFEQRMGYALDREKLESAGRVLSCPIKAAAPSWQQGRVIYAAWRHYLAQGDGPVTALDIGTAKGFSALCALWAVRDSQRGGEVHSVDVMPPTARVRRNTPAECDSLKTLAEILAPWPEAQTIRFHELTGAGWLQKHKGRVNLAFVDGKHSHEAVSVEAQMLAARQESGDLVIFDDVQMPPVGKAVRESGRYYDVEILALGSVNRAYGIGVRK